MLTYLINKDQKPLMPCSAATGRVLLKSGQAKVWQKTPFTLQLDGDGDRFRRPDDLVVKLNINIGSKVAGFVVLTDDQVLFQANLELRTDISGGTDDKPKEAGKMYKRRGNRRSRRNRLRYRKARWLNRGNKIGLCKVCGQNAKRGKMFCSIHEQEGHHKFTDIEPEIVFTHLPPSIRSIIDSYDRLVKKIRQILPVSEILVSIAEFDIQKIKNPDIQGKEYQEGPARDYNLMEYLKAKFTDHGLTYCAACKENNRRWKKIHIKLPQYGGSDVYDNWALVCESCFDRIVEKGEKLRLRIPRSFKNETTVNVIKDFIVKNCQAQLPTTITYGYITKQNRDKFNIKKHYFERFINALCMEGYQGQQPWDWFYYYKCIPKGNYRKHDANPIPLEINKKLPDGSVKNYTPKRTEVLLYRRHGETIKMRKALVEPNKSLNGFKKYDKVLFKGKHYFVKALMSNGNLKLQPLPQSLCFYYKDWVAQLKRSLKSKAEQKEHLKELIAILEARIRDLDFKYVSYKKVKKLESRSTMPVEIVNRVDLRR